MLFDRRLPNRSTGSPRYASIYTYTVCAAVFVLSFGSQEYSLTTLQPDCVATLDAQWASESGIKNIRSSATNQNQVLFWPIRGLALLGIHSLRDGCTLTKLCTRVI